MNLVSEQRYLLLKRLDVLSVNLKREPDSLKAEQILQEMRNITVLLKVLTKGAPYD